MKATLALLLLNQVVSAQATPAAASFSAKLGPAVGSKAPTFEAKDQAGNLQSLASLRGPKGLILLFIRSADW